MGFVGGGAWALAGPALAALGLLLVAAMGWATDQPLPGNPKVWLTTLIVVFGLSIWGDDAWLVLAGVSGAIGRMAALRADLGQGGRDAHLAQLVEVRARETLVIERIGLLQRDLQRRRATLDEKRATLAKRAELLALKQQTSAIVGAADTTPERIAAEVEVGVADLRTELASSQAEIAAESRRSNPLTR